MSEININNLIGKPTSKFGNERQMYTHQYDSNLLIGVENEPRNEKDMRLYLLTTNLFRAIFPDNFAKVVGVQNTGEKSLSLVQKINAESKFGPEYKRAKQKFLQNMSSVFVDSSIGDLDEMFDFKGDKANLLMSNGNPVYVDKINPNVVDYLDDNKIIAAIPNFKKREAVLSLLSKIRHEFSKRKQEKEQEFEILSSL